MREILFRGRQTDKDRWVYGVPVNGTSVDESEILIVESVFNCEEYYCRGCEFSPVIPETVGQYTGLTDKNGTKIFEGDILKTPAWYTVNDLPCVVIFGEEHTVSNVQGFGLYHYINESYELVCSDEWDEFEVIGNIHDNPELLEGGE